MKHVLSISGGGIRGVIPAFVLAAIEDMLGVPNSQIWDLVAGTSTGGILACGIGAGISASRLLRLYAARGGEIFSRPWWRYGAFLPKYPEDGINKVLSDTFGVKRFTHARTKLLIPAFDQWKDVPVHFKSWDCESDLYFFDVCRATSSAPTYFAAYQGRYSDGGLFANDPSLNAYAEACRLWPDEQIMLLSLGTGYKPGHVQCPQEGGLSDWVKPILSILLDAPAADIHYMCDTLLRKNYLTIQGVLPETVNPAMDDATEQNIFALTDYAEQLLARNQNPLANFLHRMNVNGEL